jgi:site-specific recombinase XerD
MLHPTIEDAWSDFRRSLARKGRSEDTVAIYRKSFESFWRWADAASIPRDPSAVSYRDVNAWVDWMLEQPATRGGRTQYTTNEAGERVPQMVTANTIRIRWQNLRPFFSWWAKEMETGNPFDQADTPRLDEAAVPVVRYDDLRLLIHACDGKDLESKRDEALIRLMVGTGARVGEVVSMTTDSWSRHTDVVTLTGKTGTRTYPLSPAAGEAMSRYVRLRTQHPKSNLPALWLGLRGPLSTGGVAQMIYRRCDQAGIARVHPHALRHSWAHYAKVNGASEGDLMALGGWSSTQMVHRYGKSAAIERAHDTARRIKIGDEL